MRGELGGGTLAAKVAGNVEQNRAVRESSEADEAVSPEESPTTGENEYARDAGASAFDDDGPGWPSESEESAFLSQQAASGEPARSKEDEEELDSDTMPAAKKAELPALDTLVARIPAETRQVLDELFRARFVKVKKFPKKFINE